MLKSIHITGADVTTVALPMRGALLHSDGESVPYQIRHILQLHTDAGITGLGEATPRAEVSQVHRGVAAITGEDPFQLERIGLRLSSQKFYRMDEASVATAVQMACLDIQGKAIDRPVADLLGGRMRESVPVIAYVFQKRGAHGYPSVIGPEGVVEEAQRLCGEFGFRTVKFKAGANSPEQDVEIVAALRRAFPDSLLRVDPNAAWSAATAVRIGMQLAEFNLEWLEDPTLGLSGMSEFNRRVPVPTATNMCCIHPREFPSAIAARAIDVMLLDTWYLGGPWNARQMASICHAFDIGVGIHAGGGSAETGIGLAAEVQLAAALPTLVHAIDTMNTELADDVVRPGTWQYSDGNLALPDAPGLGVELDDEKLARGAETFAAIKAGKIEAKRQEAFPAYPLY